MTHKKYYYAKEAKSLLYLALLLICVQFIYIHKDSILSFIFSVTGLIYLCFLTAAVNLALVIKIYYRMQVIKYYEKDTRIRLFNE
jgi:hypothetical protein